MATDARGALSLRLRDLTREFYNLNKGNPEYSELELEDVHQIVKGSLVFTKKCLNSPHLPTLHIKHFGKFVSFPGRIRNRLADNESRYRAGKRSEKEYLQVRQEYNQFLHLLETREETHSQGFILIDDIEDVTPVRAITRARKKMNDKLNSAKQQGK